MDRASSLAQIETDGLRLVEAASSHLDAEVPMCPGWTAADLLAHIGRVHRTVALHVEQRATQWIQPPESDAPPEADVAGYAAASLDRLLSALTELDPDEKMWTWSAQHNGAFYLRRMLHETSIHRVDAEGAAGMERVVEGDLAADGVDELYGIVIPFVLARGPRPMPTGTLHVHRTDGAGEWMLTVDGDQIRMERAHAKGDAAVRGHGSSLFLACWGRAELDAVEILGDTEVAEQWIAMAP